MMAPSPLSTMQAFWCSLPGAKKMLNHAQDHCVCASMHFSNPPCSICSLTKLSSGRVTHVRYPLRRPSVMWRHAFEWQCNANLRGSVYLSGLCTSSNCLPVCLTTEQRRSTGQLCCLLSCLSHFQQSEASIPCCCNGLLPVWGLDQPPYVL